MKMFVRLLVVLVVLAAAAGAGWYYFMRPKPEPVPQTAIVARGDIEQSVLATGELTASALVSVGAEVTGRVENLPIMLGQKVTKGDLIAEIDPLDRQNAVKLAEAALANIEAQRRIQAANAAQAEVAARRAEQLKTQNLTSDADYQLAQVALETTKAQLDAIDAQIVQAKLNVDSAQLNLSRTRIVAPVDGTVVAVLVEAGQTVNAAQSAPTIVKIANLEKMIVKAGISEADVPNVKPGQRVYFTILGDPDNKIDATLLSVEPAPESINSTSSDSSASTSAIYYNGTFEVPNPDGLLRIAMTAQVTIVINESKNALLIPASALGRKGQGGKYMVEVYDPVVKTRQQKPVSIGIDNKVMAEVLDGLNEGEEVIANSAGAAGNRTNGQNSRRPSLLPFG